MSPQVERPRPPYQQVADHLRHQIVVGELRPGDLLPSERQIVEEWGVARSTATKVLATLRSEGLVESRQGVGTVVVGSESLYRRVGERYETVRRTGWIFTPGEYAVIVRAEIIAGSRRVVEALALTKDAPVIERHRITYNVDDEPIACSTSWFDAALEEAAPRLLERSRIRQGTAAYVEEVTGRRMRHGQDQIYARLATNAELDELRLSQPSAVLVIQHTVWDTAGQPLSHEEGIAPEGRWTTYQYEIPSD